MARTNKRSTPTLRNVASQPSWTMRSSTVELSLTQLGGHMAPVTFFRNTAKSIRPYYVNTWHDKPLKIDDPVLVPLRGDFFCLPFGDNVEPVDGVQFVGHGEPATGKWTLNGIARDGKVSTLTATQRNKQLKGKVTKCLQLVDGQNVVYCSHKLEGFDCVTSLGHHATLALPAEAGALLIATSKFDLGMTNPTPIDDPATGAYQAFEVGKTFDRLDRVPLAWQHQPVGDCSRFPTRKGFDDILGLFKKPAPTPAWITATNTEAGYLWFALKDPAILPATTMWMANGGNRCVPLAGTNTCLGIEDGCAYFAQGLAESAASNRVNRKGFKTAMKLTPDTPTTIRYIQGAVKVPGTFGRVKKVTFEKGKVIFYGQGGRKASARVAWRFLADGELNG
jgi:hypothetical protein